MAAGHPGSNGASERSAVVSEDAEIADVGSRAGQHCDQHEG